MHNYRIENQTVRFFIEENNPFLLISDPVELEFWDGDPKAEPHVYTGAYDTVQCSGQTTVCTAEIQSDVYGKLALQDQYEQREDRIVLKRKLTILEQGSAAGVRLMLSGDLFPQDQPTFRDLRYFSPPAIFDKNDLDLDGVEDYFHTTKLLYRDDRMNYPRMMAYSEQQKKAVFLGRHTLPVFDSYPEREEKANVFLQKTDIGSIGIWGEEEKNVRFRACYPFYETTCIALYIIHPIPIGAFWPMEQGEVLEVSYELLVSDASAGFNAACWEGIRNVIRETKPKPVELLTSIETINKYRLEALDRYYVEKTAEEDPNCPAGYVLNCHPQQGDQLENIIQYGFTGQNVLNAYNVLRYGLAHDNKTYVDHALKIADFFADKIHIPSCGMFYNLYNVDQKQVNFWWTGLLLPLAYAVGDELKQLMGPLYDYRYEVIKKLQELEGSYLRCMNEDADALLKIYRFEKDRGVEHPSWINAVRNYCEFLLRVQEPDGSWYRAYDLTGKPITEPKLWFGTQLWEQRSTTGTTIPLLVNMYHLTQDVRYLEAAERAGLFVKQVHIDTVRYNGGVHDSIYAKGQLIDNESMMYPMFGMLALYKATKKQVFLEGAIDAAHFCASWVCLWDIPMPKDSTLARYGFRSTGIGACDTPGAGYTHPFQLMCVCEIAEIAVLAQDQELLTAAELYWHGCNQYVSLPEKDWGYKYYGLQEEGVLVSWFAVDDPMFAESTGFGHRWKGEGNKTCFPWIQAVALKGYWALMDRFGTTDFSVIRKQNFQAE